MANITLVKLAAEPPQYALQLTDDESGEFAGLVDFAGEVYPWQHREWDYIAEVGEDESPDGFSYAVENACSLLIARREVRAAWENWYTHAANWLSKRELAATFRALRAE